MSSSWTSEQAREVWSKGGSSSNRDLGAFSTAELGVELIPGRTGATDDDEAAGKSAAGGSASEGTETTELLVGSAVVTAELEPPQFVHGAVTGAGLV